MIRCLCKGVSLFNHGFMVGHSMWGILTSSRLLLRVTIMLCHGSIVWTSVWRAGAASVQLFWDIWQFGTLTVQREKNKLYTSLSRKPCWVFWASPWHMPKNGRRRGGADRDHLEVSVLGWRLACGIPKDTGTLQTSWFSKQIGKLFILWTSRASPPRNKRAGWNSEIVGGFALQVVRWLVPLDLLRATMKILHYLRCSMPPDVFNKPSIG